MNPSAVDAADPAKSDRGGQGITVHQENAAVAAERNVDVGSPSADPSRSLSTDSSSSSEDPHPSEGSPERSGEQGGHAESAVQAPDAHDDNDEIDQDALRADDDETSETIMSDPEAGPPHEGKRVKVYELRDSSWFDRGTGYCKGIYDDTQDLALLIVEAEEPADKAGENEGEGGFLKEDLLLTARVEKEDIYVRQQDTLIVWTEPTTNLDIALSFQDAEGCEDIWQFIGEVQRHLNNLPADNGVPSSSSPLSASPMMSVGGSMMASGETRATWDPPTLANIKQQENWIRMQAKSAQGRERAVEHIIGEDYIKQLISVFDDAEDLESLEDLHALCSLMQTILMFNDNTLLEYILQDDVFLGVIGIFEYDPDFPNLKAAYRQFFKDVAKFRQVVEIKDATIRTKIHQLFRVQYLRDVVLARMLDDGTFGILNGFVFFTQVDIINYIQNNDAFLHELLSGFQDDRPSTPDLNNLPPLDERRRDIVLLLNQLMILGKGVQLPSRLALYRNLLDRGLLYAVEWALRRTEAQLLHAGAEILTLVVDLDVSAVRMHVLKEDEMKRRTLIVEMIRLLGTTKNIGLLSQVGESLRNLLETAIEESSFLQRKEGPISENFIVSFYENCVGLLYKPLIDLPEIKRDTVPLRLSREQSALLHLLVELLSASVLNQAQHQRATYFILSNPISKKIVSLLYVKDKPLRHAALRFIRSCLKLQNHFVNRYFVKNELLVPLIDVLDSESTRDNMMSSACMEVLDIIRKENVRPIINHLFESYRPRIESLSSRPQLRQLIFGLTVRWQQNNEPPPPPVQLELPDTRKPYSMAIEAQEDNYFNASDDEDDDVVGPKPPSESGNVSPQKRKRVPVSSSEQLAKRPSAPSPSKMLRRKNDSISTAKTGTGRKGYGTPRKGVGVGSGAGGGGLVDYDDGSDSDGSAGAQSPLPRSASITDFTPDSGGDTASSTSGSSGGEGAMGVDVTKEKERLEDGLGDVGMMMRAKRLREEEEEEGFAGLLVKAGSKKESSAATATRTETQPEDGSAGKAGGEEEDKTVKEEAKKGGEGQKKIRLSFAPLKKLPGMGGGK